MPEACLNCGHAVAQKFCSNCGQAVKTRRLETKDVLSDVLSHFFNLDGTLFRTIGGLTRNPGKVCREYVAGQRVRYVPPLRYCITILAIVLLAYALFGIDLAQPPFEQPSTDKGERVKVVQEAVGSLIKKHLNLVIFAALPFLVVFTRFLFRKADYNLPEVGVFVLYTIGHIFLMGILLVPVRALWPQAFVGLRFILHFGFFTWAALGFFGLGRLSTLFRSVAANALYFLSIVIIIVLATLPTIIAAM